MPSYEYKCGTCFQTLTVVRSIHEDDPGYECANCKVPMHQMISGVGVTFRGGGWGHSSN
jgi:putative FmdB family regulatory protein